MRIIAVLILPLLVCGCSLSSLQDLLDAIRGGDPNDVFCTEIYVYGLTVNVTDADTDEPLAGAVLTLVDGDYEETMMAFPSGGYVGAGERAGTYVLTVAADGYLTQTIEDIAIDEDECHVIPVTRDVALTPESDPNGG